MMLYRPPDPPHSTMYDPGFRPVQMAIVGAGHLLSDHGAAGTGCLPGNGAEGGPARGLASAVRLVYHDGVEGTFSNVRTCFRRPQYRPPVAGSLMVKPGRVPTPSPGTSRPRRPSNTIWPLASVK